MMCGRYVVWSSSSNVVKAGVDRRIEPQWNLEVPRVGVSCPKLMPQRGQASFERERGTPDRIGREAVAALGSTSQVAARM